jgi:hypothetical protein
MLVIMWLLWESYFAAVGGCAKLMQLGEAYAASVRHVREYGAAERRDSSSRVPAESDEGGRQ